MARLGMRQEARLVRSYRFRGEWADQLVFAVLADEWRSRSAAAGPSEPARRSAGPAPV